MLPTQILHTLWIAQTWLICEWDQFPPSMIYIKDIKFQKRN